MSQILIILLFTQFNPWGELEDVYSPRYFSTGFLMKDAEEYIINPSYLFLLGNSHLFTNLKAFVNFDNRFVFGGNLNTDPLREGASLKIGGGKIPLENILGFRGYSRKDTVEFLDEDADGVFDKTFLKKFETNGDSSLFDLSGYVGVQFLFDEWFISGSLTKLQSNSDVEYPGDLANPMGYFAYREIEVTSPDNNFIRLVEGNGDYLKKTDSNMSHVRLGGGVFLNESSFVSVLLGYRILENRLSSGKYYSFMTDYDTTRQEVHLLYDQARIDEENSLEGNGFSIGVDYFGEKRGNFREINFLFVRDHQDPDTIWDLRSTYTGIFNTIVDSADTFLATYDSTMYQEKHYTSSKGKVTNYFRGAYSELINISENVRIAFGVNGYFKYTNFPKTYGFLDSTEVISSDGDSLSNGPEDYERYIFYRFKGSLKEEEKIYSLQIPFGIELNPFGYNKIKLRAGSIYNFTHAESKSEEIYNPIGTAVDSTFWEDSTSTVATWRIPESRRSNSLLEEYGKVFLFYGLSIELNKNIELAAFFKNDTQKLQDANVSLIIKF